MKPQIFNCHSCPGFRAFCKKLFVLSLCFIAGLSTVVAGDGQMEGTMAETMRSSGKIYVVVVSLVIIFIGILIYVIRLDRQLKKLEKEDQNSLEEL